MTGLIATVTKENKNHITKKIREIFLTNDYLIYHKMNHHRHRRRRRRHNLLHDLNRLKRTKERVIFK
jgi:hypothetical protein